MRRNFRSVALVLSITFLAAVAAANADDAPVASGVSADGKVHADMFSLKRTEGDTTLRFAIVNDSNRTVSTTLENMRLIDLVGRTSYEPGVTSSSCSAEPGGKAICWAVFAAPGPNTKSINVKFYDAFDLISTPITN